METELNKKDLISLVKGTSPYYSVMSHPLVKQSGNYTGGFHDKWDWSEYQLEQLTEVQLWEVYTVCKNSWSLNTK